MKTIAEGVERPDQRVALQELGCDYIQGYLFADADAAGTDRGTPPTPREAGAPVRRPTATVATK